MKLKDLQHGSITLLELTPAEQPAFDAVMTAGAQCTLTEHPDTGEVLLGLEKPGHSGEFSRFWRIQAVGRKGASSLSQVLGRNLPRVQYILASSPKDAPSRVTVKVHEFTGIHCFSNPLEAGLDDKIQRELKINFIKGNSTPEQLNAYLKDEVLLPPGRAGGLPRVLLCATPGGMFDDEKAFRLLGRELIVDLARDASDRLVVRRISQFRKTGSRDGRPLMLVEVALSFPDLSVTGHYRGAARATLEQLVQRNESYLSRWKEYNALEKRSLARQARAFRWLRYATCRESKTGAWRFEITIEETGISSAAAVHERISLLQEGGFTLEASREVPLPLRSESPRRDVGESLEQRREREAQEDELLLETLQSGKNHFLGTYEAHRSHGQQLFLELAPTDPDQTFDPPDKGFLFVSVKGDVVRLRRRETAEADIRTAQNPMPQLSLILEDQPAPIGRFDRLKSMSQSARARFKGPPTPAQLKALEIALNTPDIVLIQGPPGTGKTQVITALEVLLAEAGETAETLSGAILLSSFQHDAVENAAERTEVLGLPAAKVGKRQGQETEVDPAGYWRQKQVAILKGRLLDRPEGPFEALRLEVTRFAVLHRKSPGDASKIAVQLRRLTEMLRGQVDPDLTDALAEAARTLELSMRPQLLVVPDHLELQRKAVHALRITETAFRDDGPQSALKLLRRIQGTGLLSDEQVRLLEKAGAWTDEQALDFLPMLEKLRSSLLDALAPVERPPVRHVANPEIDVLLARVVDSLCARERSSQDGIDAALWTYLEDLENDPIATTAALKEYTMVLAATCQQAVGKEMRIAKDSERANTTLAFESVIIDEAARANPLDLLVPMSRASRRIVLVGDHRQLPHMLEPDLARDLEANASELTLKALRQSLFQRLYEQLEQREKTDNIPRTVMLDTQFRMHPSLGDFISRHFYEGRLKSGGRPTDFAHNLPSYSPSKPGKDLHVGVGACMAWLEVPLSRGREEGGRSKGR